MSVRIQADGKMLALRAGRNHDLHAVAGNRGRGRGIIVVIGIRPFEAGQFAVFFFIIKFVISVNDNVIKIDITTFNVLNSTGSIIVSTSAL